MQRLNNAVRALIAQHGFLPPILQRMHLDIGSRLDRYVLTAPIGSGGQGFVYRVTHAQLGTDHALKVVTGTGPRVRERLIQEGRAQAKLRHPNIVTVTDVIEVDGDPGLIMEYIGGPSLAQLIADGPMSVAQLDALVAGILEGVSFAHAQQFIHRDLKPDNILCNVTSQGLVPKITDFGLVKALGPDSGDQERRQTRTGAMMGTAQYMSPEQIRSTKHVDERSDVWALGVIFYEMVTGRLPFEGPDVFETFAAITKGAYTPVKQLAPDAPERFVAAIDSALQVEPTGRCHSARKLLALWNGSDFTRTPAPTRRNAGAWDAASLARYAPGPEPEVVISKDEGGTWGGSFMLSQSDPGQSSTVSTLEPETSEGEGSRDTAAPVERSRSSAPVWVGVAVFGLVGLAIGSMGLVGLGWTLGTGTVREPLQVSAEGDATLQGGEASLPIAEELVPSTVEAEPAAAPPSAAPARSDPQPLPAPESAPKIVTVPRAPTPIPVQPSPAAPEPQPAEVDAVVTAPEPAPAPVRPAPAARPRLGTFSVSGRISEGHSVYLEPADGSQYVTPGKALPQGTYTLVLRLSDTVKRFKTIEVRAGQSIEAVCDSPSEFCRIR